MKATKAPRRTPRKATTAQRSPPKASTAAPAGQEAQRQPNPVVECHILGLEYVAALEVCGRRFHDDRYIAAARTVREIQKRLENPLIVVSRQRVAEVVALLDGANADEETRRKLTEEVSRWPTNSPQGVAREIEAMPIAAKKLEESRQAHADAAKKNPHLQETHSIHEETKLRVFELYDKSKLPKHERAARIAKKLRLGETTVRGYLRKRSENRNGN